MNLGLGLIAADNYFKEGDARKERDYVQAKRDAELSTLDDKTNADRSGYRLRNDQNSANSRLLPNQTRNAESRLSLDALELAAEAERKPNDLKAKGLASEGSVVNAKAANINAGIGLSNAQNDQDNLPKSLQIKNNEVAARLQTSDAELANLPKKLARAATQGVIDEKGQGEVVLGNLGKFLANKDKNGALNFANEIAKVGNVLPNTNGKTFTDIVPVRKGQEGATEEGFIFVTSDGQRSFVPDRSITSAHNALRSGKYKFIERGDGSIFAGNEDTGSGGIVEKGDPTMLRTGGTDTAEIKNVEYLLKNGLAKSKGQAWDMTRSVRSRTRNGFIEDFVTKNATTEDEATKMAEQAGRIYDSLRKYQEPTAAQPPAPNSAPASNTPALGTLDPQLKSLLGLP